MSKPADKPKRRWRLPRWSMATMFVGVTIACIAFGLVLQPVGQRKRTIESLRTFDGVTILYDYEVRALSNGSFERLPKPKVVPPGSGWLRDLIGIDYFADVVDVKFSGSSIRDDDLRRLRHFGKMRSLSLWECYDITDACLEHLTRHTELKWLDIYSSQFTRLPPEIGKLTELTGLSLKYNELAEIPPEIGQLTKLTELFINGNQLATLPPEIGKLTKLTDLILSNNRLSKLPPEIGRLRNLRWLSLSVNQFTTLPPEIGKLRNLEYLNLQGNDITDADLEYLKSLKNLDEVDLVNTKVTKNGVKSLKWALPNCEIVSDFR